MKIIKLTESDLTNIVKRVIKENTTKDSLIDMIKYDGWESAAELVGGTKNLLKVINIKTPMEFLHLFDDMNIVQSEEQPFWSLFRYEEGNNLIVRNRAHNLIYVNDEEVWNVLKIGFKVRHSEIKKLIEEWVYEAYNLRVVGVMVSNQDWVIHTK